MLSPVPRRSTSEMPLNSSRYSDGDATIAAISVMVVCTRRSPYGNNRQNSSTVSIASTPIALA